jgi:hypothetical protein
MHLRAICSAAQYPPERNMLGRPPFRTDDHQPPRFWNISGLLSFYLRSLSDPAIPSRRAVSRPPILAHKSLARAWETAGDACTIDDALQKHRIVAQLLATEIDRVQAANEPTAFLLLRSLRQQQVACANNILMLMEAAAKDEKVILPLAL